MIDPKQALDTAFLEMRWRCLSLAADLDRMEKSPGGADVLQSDSRAAKLRSALAVLLEQRGKVSRAERVQMIFSDVTPPPAYKK
jgi:hypothetical protein